MQQRHNGHAPVIPVIIIQHTLQVLTLMTIQESSLSVTMTRPHTQPTTGISWKLTLPIHPRLVPLGR